MTRQKMASRQPRRATVRWVPQVSGWVTALVTVGGLPTVGFGQQRSARPASRAALVFDRTAVVDVEQGKVVPDQRVVIRGNRVEAVGGADKVPVPAGARVVDASGKFLLPGLWDMHTHVFADTDRHASLVANGVTGIREMSGTLDQFETTRELRKRILAGEVVGPRIVVTGHDLYSPVCTPGYGAGMDLETDSAGCAVPNGQTVRTPEEARAMVDTLKQAGVDFVKAHAIGNRQIYLAFLSEARRIGIPAVGHLGGLDVFPLTEVEASDSGIRSVEHINELLCWQTRFEDVAKSPVRRTPIPSATQVPDTVAERQCRTVAEHFTRNGTWLDPTLYVFTKSSDISPEDQQTSGPYLMEAVGIAYRAGIPMLAGTDVHGGQALPEELGLLVEAGMTPIDALRAATLNPAKFFGATDSLGTVAQGKLADLILLDADPLVNIHNVKRIRAVVANGRYLDRTALDTLIAQNPIQ